MSKKLSEFVRFLTGYDLEVTKLGAERGLKAGKRIERKELRYSTFNRDR